MGYDVFICHSSKDRAIANAICAKLEQNHIRCWIAPRDVVPGSEFAESIIEGLQSCKLTILVFSANSNDSAHVHKEIERSVNRGRPILPFRVEDVVPSPALEYFISDAHWLDALTPPVERHLDYLVETVRLLLRRAAGPTAAGEDELPRPALETPTPGPATPARRRTLLWGLVGGVVVLAVVAAGLVVLLRGGGGGAGASSTASSTSKGFVDEFTTGVAPGWTWQDEDPTTWKVGAGWLRIRAQQAPPYRNVLLRKVPTAAAYSVRIRIRPGPGAGAFAGLVFMGTNPDSRLQFGWAGNKLAATEYHDGNIVNDAWLKGADMPPGASRDLQLVLTVKDGWYKANYYNPREDSYWDLGTQRLDSSFTRVGLLVYAKGTTAPTAAFDRIAFY